MGRTHDIIISGFDLDRIEAENNRMKNLLLKWLEWARAHGHLEHAAGIVADTRDILSNASDHGHLPAKEGHE